jgi:SAM-dependent methyltransferase
MKDCKLGRAAACDLGTVPLALLKIRVKLETLRSLYRIAYRMAGWFIDLDAIEYGLLNSRLIEYPFVLKRLVAHVPGRLLDIGCTDNANFLAPTLADLGWQVYGIDVRAFKLTHPNFNFILGDIRSTDFPDSFFDYAYAISTLEHIGLAGRYGVTSDDSDGDSKAVQEVRRVLKSGGIFLVTVPYGVGGIVRPSERVYDRTRLQRLVRGWSIRRATYYFLDNDGAWHEVSEEIAGRTKTPGGVCVALLELVNGKEA